MIPAFLNELLAQPPTAGAGVHRWMFRCARQLHVHLPAVEIVQLLEEKTRACGRSVPRREIVAAVQDSIACAWQRNSGEPIQPPVRRWPAVNTEQRAAIVRDGGKLADLWEASPVRLEDDATAEHFIDALFLPDALLCCGKSSSIFATKPRADWRGKFNELSLIVPSPMTARTGKTKDGRESAHTLENTGPRRFLVCEFDSGTTDEHAALLLHLAEFAPLTLAVHSGGKSLHGWFFVEDEPEERVEKFFRYAVSLGADPATWTRSQFVRMPEGRRENGAKQKVYFLNTEPTGGF